MSVAMVGDGVGAEMDMADVGEGWTGGGEQRTGRRSNDWK